MKQMPEKIWQIQKTGVKIVQRNLTEEEVSNGGNSFISIEMALIHS